MRKNRKMGKSIQPIKCIVYLASKETDERQAEKKENGQLHAINGYAKKYNLQVMQICRQSSLGRYHQNCLINNIAEQIKKGKAEAILMVNVSVMTTDILDVYTKIGKIKATGGRIITVDAHEVELSVPLCFGGSVYGEI